MGSAIDFINFIKQGNKEETALLLKETEIYSTPLTNEA